MPEPGPAQIPSAAVGPLPRLRPDLRTSQQTYEGKTYFVIKDPITLQYYRMERQEHFIASQLDGERTASDLRTMFDKQFPDEPTTEESILRFVNLLGQLGFLQLSGAKSLVAIEAQRKVAKTKWTNLVSRSMLYFRVPVIDPDHLLRRLVRPLRFLWTPWFGFVSIAVMIVALAFVTWNLGRFEGPMPDFFTPHNLILFWISFVLMKTIHEFGHGLTCRHYGGEVHEMGLLMIVFTPYFYCDVTDAWMIPRKWPKVLITAAGIYVEIILAAIAAIIWCATQPGLLNQWAFNMMILGSISTFIFNANPLLKFDGYYALADIMEIPNLRARSNQYVNLWLRKLVFGTPIPPEIASKERGRLFVFYAIASYIYGWIVLISIMLIFRRLLEPYGLGFLGTWMSYFAFITWIVMPMYQFIQSVRKEAAQKPESLHMRRPARIGLAVAVGAVIVAVFPTRYEVDRRCVIETHQMTVVRPAVPGLVKEVRVREGDHVEAGQVLAVLENRIVSQQHVELQEKLRIADLIVQQKEITSDMGAIKEAQLQREQVRLNLDKAAKDHGDLTLRAPIDGIVVTPRMGDRVGRYYRPNEDFCAVAPLETLRAVVPLDQHEASLVRAGAPAKLRVFARTGNFQCAVKNDPLAQIEEDVHPALTTSLGGDVAAQPDPQGQIRPSVKTYQAELLIANSELLLRPGMAGRVHIYGERTTWGGRIVRAVSDSLSLDWRL